MDLDVINAFVVMAREVSANGVTAQFIFWGSDGMISSVFFGRVCMHEVHLKSVHKSVFSLPNILEFTRFASDAINEVVALA